jgi:hypothetical protein
MVVADLYIVDVKAGEGEYFQIIPTGRVFLYPIDILYVHGVLTIFMLLSHGPHILCDPSKIKSILVVGH